MSLLELVLIAGATARLVRLAQTDDITEPLRRPLVRRAKAAESLGELRGWAKLYELLVCPWCLSIWFGAGFAVSWIHWGDARWWAAVGAALTASLATGVYSIWEDR